MNHAQHASIGILHYSAPPVVGGVEAVLTAQARLLVEQSYRVTVIAGQGQAEAMPIGVDFTHVPLMDTQNPLILKLGQKLDQGQIPSDFEEVTEDLVQRLRPILVGFDWLIVHNIFTKHFNLPLTAALWRLLDAGRLKRCLAWSHDLTWTSSHSREKVRPGYPWDLLRTGRDDVTYVAVSEKRQAELAGLFGWPKERIPVVYNGVDRDELLGLSREGAALIERLGIWEADLVMLMPVRVTQAKNIEYALRVVSSLKKMGCHVRLVITGPPDPHSEERGAYYQSLLDLRAELGLEQEARFVYQSGPQPEQPYFIPASTVGELYRVCDLVFMPSHREGFGMPILEAGLVGVPAFSAPFPAAVENGREDVAIFDPQTDEPAALARRILRSIQDFPTQRFRRRVRQEYTWQAIFRHQLKPLLEATR